MPSVCTHNVVKAFFANGTLPPDGTVCPADYPPFFDGLAYGTLQDADARRFHAQDVLGRIMPLASRGLSFDYLLE
jgi:hypothetical protein